MRTLLFRVRELDSRELRVWLLLGDHGDVLWQAEQLKRFEHCGVADAVHGSVHELQRCLCIEGSAVMISMSVSPARRELQFSLVEAERADVLEVRRFIVFAKQRRAR